MEYGVDSWNGPNSGMDRPGILIQHKVVPCGPGRVVIARALVDLQCVLIFEVEADLRNPLTRQRIVT